MIEAALAVYLAVALPGAVETVRARRFIVVARKRPEPTETPFPSQDASVVMLRVSRDATFDERWRALQGY